MPTYDYKCKECGHSFELFQSMSEKPRKACPGCGKPALVRLIGTGAGIIFKGTGFYETDYKRHNGGRAKSAADATPTESKPCANDACPAAKECPAAKKAP